MIYKLIENKTEQYSNSSIEISGCVKRLEDKLEKSTEKEFI